MSVELLARLDEMEHELVDAVSRAVRIPSVTPNYPGERYEDHVGGEGAVSRAVAELYREAGCEVDVFGLVPGRENAVGVLRGAGDGRSLIFNGHVDVVPPGPAAEWTGGDPWSGRVADGALWGRGSVDMKAGVVAQAFAAIALERAGIRLRGDLILEAVVGEEMMEHELGTTACIERGYRADAAVVSEPSAPPEALAVVPATPGLMWFEVSVVGRATHTSMRGETIRPGGYGSAVGVNAIDKAVIVYEALRELERRWGDEKAHPLFRPGHFSIHPGVFVGGPSSGLVPFAISDTARIDYVTWFPPDEPPEAIRAEIEACIGAAAATDPWLREHPPAVEWKSHWPSSSVDPSHPIVAAAVAAHERASGRPAVVHGFAAVHDAAFLTAAGIPAIGYGPGDLRDAHALDEHVALDQLMTAVRTYALLAADWCGVAPPRTPPSHERETKMADGYAVSSWEAEPGGARRELAGLGSRYMGFAETRLAPGEVEAIEALDDVEQMHLVVAGRARVAGREASWLDAIAVPPGTPCWMEAVGDEAVRVITMSASYDGRRPERTEVRLVGWDDLRDNEKFPAPDGYRHPWPTWDPYVSRDYDGAIGTETLSFVVNRIQPGQSGQHHRHAEAEEIGYLLRGACRIKLGDDELEMREGEAVLARPELMRSFFNDSDGECFWLVVGAPIHEFNEPGLVSYHAVNRWV
jgi:acetylornithine deacetylase